MKKKMNYLILLLTIIFMVGCTNVEDTSITDVESILAPLEKLVKDCTLTNGNKNNDI